MNQQVNLYHPVFRRQQKRFSAVAMLQAGVAILAGIVLFYALSLWRIESLRAQLRVISGQQTATENRITDINREFPQRVAKPVLAAQLRQLRDEVAATRQAVRLAGREHFGSTHGYSDYLIAFARQHVQGLWLTGLSISGDGRHMTLEGRSVRPALVPRYLQRLSGEKILAGTGFRVFRIVRPQRGHHKGWLEPYVEFTVRTGGSAVSAAGAQGRPS